MCHIGAALICPQIVKSKFPLRQKVPCHSIGLFVLWFQKRKQKHISFQHVNFQKMVTVGLTFALIHHSTFKLATSNDLLSQSPALQIEFEVVRQCMKHVCATTLFAQHLIPNNLDGQGAHF